ncbi:DUF6518 family protein [Saccharothrix isguenensis]
MVTQSSPVRRTALRDPLVVVSVGVICGLLTNLGQGLLPGALNQLANSGAVWTVLAFAAGAWSSRRGLAAGVVGGLCAEVGLVVGYYGYAEIGRDGMGEWFWPVVWLVMALVAGPLFGTAGAWWRHGRRPVLRVTGLALLAGVFGAEGLHYALVLQYSVQAWACAALFAVVPLLARTTSERIATLVAAAALAPLGYAIVMVTLGGLSA